VEYRVVAISAGVIGFLEGHLWSDQALPGSFETCVCFAEYCAFFAG
jgi:hypothetical protein